MTYGLPPTSILSAVFKCLLVGGGEVVGKNECSVLRIQKVVNKSSDSNSASLTSDPSSFHRPLSMPSSLPAPVLGLWNSSTTYTVSCSFNALSKSHPFV